MAVYDLEDIFDYIGECGRFQVLLIIITNISDLGAAWGLLMMTVAGVTPEWWCSDSNITDIHAGLSNLNDTFRAGDQQCPTDGGSCSNVTFTDGGASIVSEWNLICDRKWAAGIITTIQMIGVTAGVIVTGQLADFIGRKKTFFLIYFILLLANFVSAFSPSVEVYTVCRFFVGMGCGGTLLSSTIIPIEYLGKRYRTYSNIPPWFCVGTCIMAGLAYAINSWRNLAMVISALELPFMLTWWFIPESARWLMAKGRYHEAEAILRNIAKFNKRPLPSPIQFENLEAIANKDRKKRSGEIRYSFIDLFRSFEYARKTLLLFSAWFCCGLVYYGLSFGVKNLSGDRYINLVLMAIVDVPSQGGLLLNNRIGRRYSIMLFLGLVTVCSLVVVVLESTGSQEPEVVSAMSLFAKLSANAGWNCLMVFTSEIYPTVVRNIGSGICQSGARIGSMVAPLLIELHVISPWIPYAVFSATALISVTSIFLLPETMNTNMPDFLPPRKKKKQSGEDDLPGDSKTLATCV